jgi:hypothetical protein
VSPDLVPKSMTGREPVTVRVPLEKMEKLPELRVRNFHFLITELYIWSLINIHFHLKCKFMYIK